MARLIITNGDAAAERMRSAGLNGEILAWRDILHEGPAPETDSLEALSAIRATFLAERGWSAHDELTAAFARRDAQLRDHARYDSVIVWLEHDLYDQLQLLQILDFFAGQPRRAGLYLIQSGRRLDQETPAALKRHMRLMEPITGAHLDLARLAWKAFRSPSPAAWAGLIHFDTGLFPFLRPAILRHLEELPAPRTGLTRTERTILRSIQAGRTTPRQLYADFSAEEDAMFMGDWSFWHILDQLGMGHSPLVIGFQNQSFSPQLSEIELEPYMMSQLRLTSLGINALRARADASVHRRIDRWMGGTHLTNANLWRWDAGERRLIAP